MRLEKILFASDLSPRAQRAGQRAAQLAAASGAELEAVHVIESRFAGVAAPTDSPDPLAVISAVAEQQLQESTPGLRAAPRVLVGDTVGELVRAADAGGGTLLVVGAHGQQHVKEWLLGTTAEQLVRHAHAPTLVVRGERTEPYRRVAVATDFSVCSMAALCTAAEWFSDAELHVIHVVDTDDLDRMRAAGIGEDRVQQHYRHQHREAQQQLQAFVDDAKLATPSAPRLEVHAGNPGRVAVEALTSLEADLVVIGNHGRGRWGNVLLGSLATRLLRELPTDILLVREESK